MTTTVDEQMAFYESRRTELESEHFGKWAVIHDEELQGVYETTDDANEVAQPLFKKGPCVVLRIGALKTPAMSPYVGLA